MRVLAIALIFVLAPAVAAQTTIGGPGGSQQEAWGAYGSGAAQVFGQTFTTPTDDVLESFSFWLGGPSFFSPTPAPSIDFRAYVAGWSAAARTLTTSPLYTSSLYTHTATNATPFTKYTFYPGSLVLVPGDTYVMFLAAISGEGSVVLESTGTDAYSDGSFVFPGADITQPWSSYPDVDVDPDLRFEATFVSNPVVTPEPSTVLLLATGLLGLGVLASSRRRDGRL